MVQKYGIRERDSRWLVLAVLLGILLIAPYRCAQAQGDYPGFSLRASWTEYTELSRQLTDVVVTQQLAQLVYQDPQFFWLSFGLGREEIDLEGDEPWPPGYEIDDALCFQAAGAYYLAPDLALGIPADFSVGAEYTRSRHDVEGGKLTHQRILGTANLEWDFHPAVPYLRVGVLNSILNFPAGDDEDQTTALFVGGVRFSLAQQLSAGVEFNISEDIGFGGSLGYSF
ncbi:MAG: hypothetical protein ACMUIA_03160 [bacterium]